MRVHRREARKASFVRLPCRLHLGCGSNRKSGWVNVDLDQNADLRLDLRERLPFPDNCVSLIYSEHFLEHLSLQDGAQLLRECLRVLVPGGRMSVGVPNARLCMRDYVKGDREEWSKLRDRYHPKWCTTPMHSVNYFFRQNGEHKYAYDEETLTGLMTECGFSNLHTRPWDGALDLETRRHGSLYVDGEKPSTDCAGVPVELKG